MILIVPLKGNPLASCLKVTRAYVNPAYSKSLSFHRRTLHWFSYQEENSEKNLMREIKTKLNKNQMKIKYR